jgi:hypothetical protein
LIGRAKPGKVILATESFPGECYMPINNLYHTWFQRIQELRPGQRITQIRTIVWLLVGFYQSRSVCMSRIAGKIPGPAKLVSTTRRLSRLLKNPAIRVREWYEPIAPKWLETQFHNLGEIHLAVDGTKIGFGHQLLICVWPIAKGRSRSPGPGSNMSKATAVPGNNWLCWLMYAN